MNDDQTEDDALELPRLEGESSEELDSAGDQSDALDLKADERKLVTQPYDLGVKSISTDIETGRISLTIEYQRKYVWDLGKASRLIESLLLNVPIPVCYFAEDQDGVYEVIDGLQRITTIKNFLDGKFALSGISVLKELDGKRFEDLAIRDKRRLENRTIRCIVITEDSHPDIKFDVFERLNTGAASLTAQELRNSVYRGELNDSLKALAGEKYFRDLTGNMTNRRMEAEELVLRYFSLVSSIHDYKPPLRQLLNLYMRSNRGAAPGAADVALFRETCEVVSEVLGTSPFKIGDSKNPLNKAMFDAVMIPFALADKGAIRANGKSIDEMIRSLPGDDEFTTSIGRATADRTRMLYRVGLVADRLRGLGVSVNLPIRFGLEP